MSAERHRETATGPVGHLRRLQAAWKKAAARRAADGLPVRSLRTLLDDLSGATPNRLLLSGHVQSPTTARTPVRKRAFRLPGVKPDQGVPGRLPG